MTPEVERIKSDLRACDRVVDVNSCYNHHHPRLAELWREGGDMKALCTQIKNLRDYRITCIKNGWV